jgi:RNA polymerase sigma factor (TIGR02999 family)
MARAASMIEGTPAKVEPRNTIEGLIDDFAGGRKDAADRLFSALYPELRRMAAIHMQREARAHSWQPTLLVNELYLELIRNKALDQGYDDSRRAAFFGLAGFLMKRLLILHSRPLRNRVETVDVSAIGLSPQSPPTPESLHAVEALLDRLGAIDARIRSVVELRVFEGKTHEEIAAELGCSVRTVGGCWSFARRWLEQELRLAA